MTDFREVDFFAGKHDNLYRQTGEGVILSGEGGVEFFQKGIHN